MLEKIGLPAKPALRGNEWVLDASHCQACSSAFSYFNWKHHCRRCGGLFCGNCTQQKMTLRGQGEEPVRICNSCKKLEDAARFEARHGRRHTAPKGSSNSSSEMQADLILKELIPSGSNPQNSGRTSLVNDSHQLSDTLQDSTCTSMHDEKAHSMGTLIGREGEVNEEGQNNVVTPEILRQQALEDKRQWIALKREGKNDEALLAFKRGRELERQAESLELSLRRSQRKATNSAIARNEKHEEHSGYERKKKTRNLSSVAEVQEGVDSGLEPIKSKRVLKKPEEKDEIMNALKDLGWTDADPDAGVKQRKTRSVESELADIAATVHPVEDSDSKAAISSTQVLDHKRRALALKREGKLAEAKEELKKAKIIERQLEEQETGDAEEPDDDLAALIRGMERESTTQTTSSSNVDTAGYGGMVNFEHDDDEVVEVTDSDMHDPEMAAALRSMGWEEDTAAVDKYHAHPASGAPLTSKQHGWKSLGSAGSIKSEVPAMDFMANASLNDDEDAIHVTDEDMEDPYFQSALKAMGFAEEPAKVTKPVMSDTIKSYEKRNLQQEILAIKKEALILKRAGKMQEAKEELRRAKNLEKELELLQTQHLEEDGASAASSRQEITNKNAEVGPSEQVAQVLAEKTDFDNVDVTEEDMGDPEFAKELNSFGWQDRATEGNIHTENKTEAVIPKASGKLPSEASATHPPKMRSELQKELLGLKRAALKLRKEGRLEEAEDELKKAHVLEQLMEESETGLVPPKKGSNMQNGKKDEVAQYQEDDVEATETNMKDPTRTAGLAIDSEQKPDTKTSTDESNNKFNPENTNGEVITWSKGTRIDNSDSDHGRRLSAHVQTPEADVVPSFNLRDPAESTDNSVTGVLSSPETLQQEIIAYKKRALALKREGKQAEAKEQLREAKMLEKQLALQRSQPDVEGEVSQPSGSSLIVSTGEPRTASTMASETPKESQQAGRSSRTDTGSRDSPMTSSGASRTPAQKYTAGKDRMKLQRESLAHKRKALSLRREGRMDEAEAEFDLAKSIEKQMEELGGIDGGIGSMPTGLDVNPVFGHQEKDDTGLVDDLFDPQLLSALQGLGWKESDLLGQTPKAGKDIKEKLPGRSSEKTDIAPVKRNEDRQQLEEKIKSEKVRAVQLKRSGQQSEALAVLRGAKQLEQELQSMR